MQEIVFILINKSMPGNVKIGRTMDLVQRIRSLDTTSVALHHACFKSKCVLYNPETRSQNDTISPWLI